MQIEGVAVLWPSAQNYRRFKQVCADTIKPHYRQYVIMAERRLRLIEAQGVQVRRIPFDPDALAEWCMIHFGRVDANGRAAYAAFLASEEDLKPQPLQ